MNKEAREFQVQLLDWTEIHELPDGWTPSRLQLLLAGLEVDGVPDDEALDMALLALQDDDVDEAADHVLAAVFGDGMRPGIRRNLAHDLTDERPWEDFADIYQQRGIFDAVVLMQRAFPRAFDKPDAASVAVRLETTSERGRAWLDAPAPDPALLLRILAAGMDDRAVLHRLFGEALAGPRFPEARAIIWHVERRMDVAPAREFVLSSSRQWLDPLQEQDVWKASAWIDAVASRQDAEAT